MQLTDKRILLGVTGGIAAYKSADLTRRLQEFGARVQIVMTSAATSFVTSLTFQALSGRQVRLDLLDPEAEAGMGHIELARWADLVLIAPASADFIARLAHGLANDLLSTLCLATDKPIAIAPAMNRLMWQNAATQANCQLLQQRGVRIWGPGSGEQACGEVGDGRMLEPLQIRNQVTKFFTTGEKTLQDVTLLLTAGPTREAIDPVRYISNHSSGRMGYAVAQAAADLGARVILVSGPTNLPAPEDVERIDVVSAQEMLEAVMTRITGAQIFIAVAAVADYRPRLQATQKMKKTESELTIELERNPDILGQVAALDNKPFCVGFAAETHDVVHYARTKLEQKNLDMIAANQVGTTQGGFNSEQNMLHVLWPDGEQLLPLNDKTLLAQSLINLIAEHYHANRA